MHLADTHYARRFVRGCATLAQKAVLRSCAQMQALYVRMETAIRNNIIYSTLFIIAVVVGLSVLADIAYIYTLCGLSIWAAVGHLVTLDDDMPGEWSNPDGNKKLWRASLRAMSKKFIVVVLFVWLIMAFPSLSKYGA